jgi:valyl-tRNA synthetase
MVQNDWKLQTSQGYIRILQHFVTKLWNITNFVMLFQAVMKFLFRLVKIKILEK